MSNVDQVSEQSAQLSSDVLAGGERTNLSNIEECLRCLSVAADKASVGAPDRQSEMYLLGGSIAFQKAADLVKIAIENG